MTTLVAVLPGNAAGAREMRAELRLDGLVGPDHVEVAKRRFAEMLAPLWHLLSPQAIVVTARAEG